MLYMNLSRKLIVYYYLWSFVSGMDNMTHFTEMIEYTYMFLGQQCAIIGFAIQTTLLLS